jgi:hypothetical protein
MTSVGSIKPRWGGEAAKKALYYVFALILLTWHLNSLRQMRDAGVLPLNDFIEYWSACTSFFEGGNPYNPKELLEIQRRVGWKEAQPQMMWNPPWTLPLLLPFAFLSYWTDRALFYLFSLLSVLLISDWFWLNYSGSRKWRFLSWLAVFLFVPAGKALYLGQISPLLLIGLWGFIWALRNRRETAAGAFLILLGIKPHVLYLFWVIILFWLIKERRWKIFWGGISSFAGLCLLVLIANPMIFSQYYHSLTSPFGPVIWQTPTWGAALLILFPDSFWLQYVPSIIGLGVACIFWRRWRQNFAWDRHFPTLILLCVTSSSFTWTFDWIIFLPIITLILIRIEANPVHGWWMLAGLLAILGLAVFQAIVSHNYFHSIWLPPALWLVYWVGTRTGASSIILDHAGSRK